MGNRDAGALSQRPHVTDGLKNWVHLLPGGVRTVCQGVEHRHKGATGAKAVGVTPAGVRRCYCDLTQVRSQELPQLTREDLRRNQHEDPLCNLVKKALLARDPQMLLNSPIDGSRVVNIVNKEWE